MANIGYNKDLFILPFDHRGSFQEKLFGIKGRQPTAEETREIASYKGVIYEGYKKALKMGIPVEVSGILVDEQFGEEIILDAKKNGYNVSIPAEKSGQDEFDFEYGANFDKHIEKFNPTFIKVLVRYNTEGDATGNRRQAERLKKLADFAHATNRKFMFELLVPATAEQLKQCGGSSATFDTTMRPKLMVKAMEELVRSGVEADVWKLEGIETADDSRRVAECARSGGRKDVGVIVLGRGENAEKVRLWLSVAAHTPGLIGFAVGRTVFWDSLKSLKEGKITRDQASSQIADNYAGFCKQWMDAQKKH